MKINTTVSTFNGKPTASTTFVEFNELGEIMYATVRIWFHTETEQWCVSRVRSWLDINTDTFDWGTSSSYLSLENACDAYSHVKHIWERRCKQERFFPKD